MKKVLYILIAAISVMAFSGCGMKNTVQIGTGDVNGTYYAYGTELAEILNNNSDVYFKVRKTAGSAANLRLISQEYVDIAFVQSDVMKDASPRVKITPAPRTTEQDILTRNTKVIRLLPGYIQRRYKWQCRKIRI